MVRFKICDLENVIFLSIYLSKVSMVNYIVTQWSVVVSQWSVSGQSVVSLCFRPKDKYHDRCRHENKWRVNKPVYGPCQDCSAITFAVKFSPKAHADDPSIIKPRLLKLNIYVRPVYGAVFFLRICDSLSWTRCLVQDALFSPGLFFIPKLDWFL